nr:immunoglobulin light chain junction region [Macaca mulatta]MPN92170.1 immunoglobulin light chain junction region [Macaca mulatta]MPN94983.1 immunoglobulin light chain junction region [Macaca mulatta]MPN95123.1 immunoglobulin light chain junction region [Macaca mulatta]MPN96222.1 immunoglobulin light chain junction region [Macaca mulatta]
WQQESNWPTF